MPTKYWRGGTGTWDATSSTNWSDTSGGAGGAIAPCALDDVVFNNQSNANAYTVTIAAGAVCRNLTIAGPNTGNVTVAGTGALVIYGSMTLPATGMTRTYTGAIAFRATSTGQTINTNGITLANGLSFDGGGTWTLGSALTTTSNITFVNATFNTGNFALSLATFNAISGSSIFDLGSSTVTISGNLNINSTFCTINAGTSTILMSSTAPSIGNAFTVGSTFRNMTLNSTGITSANFYGANSFNNLTFNTPSTGTLATITAFDNQTINGTLTISGSGAINRFLLTSNSVGFARTFTVNTVAALTDVDFRDITVSGTSSPWSGTRLGNAGGNTNITFGAGVNKFWNLAAGGVWTAAAWATSSGGTAAVLNFPLPQDTVIIGNTGLNTGASITGFNNFIINTLDCSTRSNAATLSGTTPRINGNLTLSTSMTVSSLSLNFEGRTAQTITSAGRTLGAITVNNYASTVTLADNYSGTSITLGSGTLDTNSKNVTCQDIIIVVNALTKVLTLGSSTVSCISFGQNSAGVSNFTLNAGTSSITLSGSSFGVEGNTLTFYNVTSTIVGSLGLRGTNTFNNLTITAPTNTGITENNISGDQTINGTLALGGGASVTQRRFFSSTTLGTQRTITAATVTGLIDVDFRDINGAGAATWTGGTRVGDCGGNSGIGFDTPKIVYWNLAGAQNWTATGWATTPTGTPATNNFPLAQDTATFTNAGSAGTVTVNALFNLGSLDMSGRTSAMTFAGAQGLNIYGPSIAFGSGVTPTFSGGLSFFRRGTQTLTTAGKTIAGPITINSVSGTFTHNDAFNSTSAIVVTSGTYSTGNNSISATTFNCSSLVARTVNLGSSTITLSGAGNVFNAIVSTNLTFNAGTSTINLSSASSKTLQGGGLTFNVVSNIGGTNTTALTIAGSNTFTTLSNTANQDLTLTSATTQTITNFNYTGATGNVVDINTTTPGLQATLLKASGPWYAGANSTDGGNNSGWTFTTGGSTNFVYIKDIIAAVTSVAQNSNFFFFMR